MFGSIVMLHSFKLVNVLKYKVGDKGNIKCSVQIFVMVKQGAEYTK